MPGVWSTNLSIASGTGAQGWVQFSEDGTYNRLVLVPRPAEDGPAACQIATGRWSAAPSGQSLIVTYTIEDYQPKQCLQTPGTPFVGCEPPPSDYQKTTQVRMVFAGPATLTNIRMTAVFSCSRKPTRCLRSRANVTTPSEVF